MSLTHIDSLPGAPLPTDPVAVFNTKAFPFVASLDPLVTQLNTLIDQLNVRAFGYNMQIEAAGTYNLANADAGNYIRLTYGSTKTIQIDDDIAGGPRIGKVWNFRNVGAGLATISATGSATIIPNALGTLTFAQDTNVSIVCVALDYYEVMGQTELA